MPMSVRTQTMVQLNDGLVRRLDERASRTGVSRSHLIREAIEAYLASDLESTIDQKIIDGYTRMPQGGEHDVDEWGDLGAWVTGLTVEQMRHLDQEDAEADSW